MYRHKCCKHITLISLLHVDKVTVTTFPCMHINNISCSFSTVLRVRLSSFDGCQLFRGIPQLSVMFRSMSSEQIPKQKLGAEWSFGMCFHRLPLIGTCNTSWCHLFNWVKAPQPLCITAPPLMSNATSLTTGKFHRDFKPLTFSSLSIKSNRRKGQSSYLVWASECASSCWRVDQILSPSSAFC